MWRNVDLDLSDEPPVCCGMRLNLSKHAGTRTLFASQASTDAPMLERVHGRSIFQNTAFLVREREPVDVSRGNGPEDTGDARLRRLYGRTVVLS